MIGYERQSWMVNLRVWYQTPDIFVKNMQSVAPNKSIREVWIVVMAQIEQPQKSHF